MLRLQLDANRQDFGANGDVLTGPPNVFARTRLMVDHHAGLAVLAEFLHHHGISPGGNRRTGKDARRRARLQRGADRAGRNALADRQADALGADVGKTHSIAVHRRVIERRHGHGRVLGNSQNTAGGGSQRQRADFFDRLGSGQQFFQGLFETQHGRSCNWRVVITKSAIAPMSLSGSVGKLVSSSASVAIATMSLRSVNNGGLPFSGR